MSLYPLHPVANLFPEMSPEDFDALKADIAAHGLLSPIWLNTRGELLDGRHRVRALQELGQPVPPDKIDTYRGDDLTAFVVGLNLSRRHLTASQRAMVAADMLPLLEAEAAERYAATVGRPKKGAEKKSTPIMGGIIPERKESAREAATIANVAHSYVSQAKHIAITAPDLAPLVRADKLTLPEATRIARATSEDTAEVRAAVTTRALQLNDTRRAVREHLRAKRVEELAAVGPPKSDAVTVLHCKLEDAALDPGSFDLVVTDPPYFVSTSDIDRPTGSTLTRDFGEWDKGDASIEDWASRIAAAMAPGASLYLFTPDTLFQRWVSALSVAGVELRKFLVWCKTNPAPQVRKSTWSSACELIIYASKGKPNIFHWQGQNEMRNWLMGPIAQGNERTNHPTQKPNWLVERIFDVSASPGLRVLDPFAGSGTTGVVAQSRGCKCTLIEPEAEFQTIIRGRLAS